MIKRDAWMPPGILMSLRALEDWNFLFACQNDVIFAISGAVVNIMDGRLSKDVHAKWLPEGYAEALFQGASESQPLFHQRMPWYAKLGRATVSRACRQSLGLP